MLQWLHQFRLVQYDVKCHWQSRLIHKELRGSVLRGLGDGWRIGVSAGRSRRSGRRTGGPGSFTRWRRRRDDAIRQLAFPNSDLGQLLLQIVIRSFPLS